MKQYKTKADIEYRTLQLFNQMMEGAELNEEETSQKLLLLFYGIKGSEYKKMQVADIIKLINELSAVLMSPKAEFKNIIIKDGIKYGFIPNFSEITASELIDITNCVQREDYGELTDILYRPIVGEVNAKGEYAITEYKGFDDKFSDVSQEIVEGYIELFTKSSLQLDYIFQISMAQAMTEKV
jgi:hypothetical protein